MAESEAAALAVKGRFLALDERDRGLRVTWRPAHGFFNLSLWSDDRCVETFHLDPADAGALVAFLGRALGEAVPEPAGAHLSVVAPATASDPVVAAPAPAGWRTSAHQVAAQADATARQAVDAARRLADRARRRR